MRERISIVYSCHYTILRVSYYEVFENQTSSIVLEIRRWHYQSCRTDHPIAYDSSRGGDERRDHERFGTIGEWT